MHEYDPDEGQQFRLCVPHDNRPLAMLWGHLFIRPKATHTPEAVLHDQRKTRRAESSVDR